MVARNADHTLLVEVHGAAPADEEFLAGPNGHVVVEEDDVGFADELEYFLIRQLLAVAPARLIQKLDHRAVSRHHGRCAETELTHALGGTASEHASACVVYD